MRSVYVSDWIPSRPISGDRSAIPTGPTGSRGSRGVGFTTVAVRSNATGAKRKVGPLPHPVVSNGPLAQRVERSKRSLKGVSGYGINGKQGAALYAAAWAQAKDTVANGIANTQKALDKIDSTTLGVDQQLLALRDAAGPSAPNDVLAVVDGATAARRDFGDSVDQVRATIDQLNAVTDQVRQAEASGNVMAGSPAQQALDKAKVKAGTLAATVAAVQRSGSNLEAKVEAATQVVNRYVDTVNAQAATLVQQQNQQAQATDIAYQLTDQQKQLQAYQAAQNQSQQTALYQQQSTVQQQQADQSAAQANAQLQFQAQLNAQLQAQQQAFQQALDRLAAQQSQYQPPSFPQVQYPPQPQQYPGGAQYAPQYPQPAPQPQVQYYQDPNQAYPAPQPNYDPMQYYQTPQTGWGGGDGPGEATGWGNQVFGLRGVGELTPVTQRMAAPVPQQPPITQPGAAPSSSALAQATARQVLAQANLKIADARKLIEQQRIEDEQKALAAAKPISDAPSGGLGTLGKIMLVGGIAYGAVRVGSAVAGRR